MAERGAMEGSVADALLADASVSPSAGGNASAQAFHAGVKPFLNGIKKVHPPGETCNNSIGAVKPSAIEW